MVWTNPSSRPHPRKRRFAQDRRDSTAVQILSPDFLGLSNYKAISLIEGFERNRDFSTGIMLGAFQVQHLLYRLSAMKSVLCWSMRQSDKAPKTISRLIDRLEAAREEL